MGKIDQRANTIKKLYPIYTTKKPNIILEGGRNSTKSNAIAYKLLVDKLLYPMGEVVCFRKHQNTLLRSVYGSLKKQIYRMELQDDFIFKPSRLQIIDKANGTGFHFFGMDDENKIKSSADYMVGIPFRYWFEEFQENEKVQELEIIEDIIVTFIRMKLPIGMFHQTCYTLNRPRNEYHLINVWYDKVKLDTDYYCNNSTYLDMLNDPVGKDWLSDDIMRVINKAKERDFKTYQWRYLGMPVGEQTKIYNVNLFRKISLEELLERGEYITEYDIVIDTGYQVSATAIIAVGITNKNNPVYLDTYYYSPLDKIRARMPVDLYRLITVATRIEEKKAPSHISVDLYNFGVTVGKYLTKFAKDNRLPLPYLDREIVDSAEGGLKVQYFTDYGIHLKSVPKNKKYKMIELSRTVMAERDCYVIDKPINQVFLWEMEKYKWMEDKVDINPEQAQVNKIDDHAVDDWQYWCILAYNKLGLE